MALRRPDLVRALVFGAGVFRHEGWAPGAIDLDEETFTFFVVYGYPHRHEVGAAATVSRS